MSDNIKTGNHGEQLAAEFLQQKGFDVVVRNYRHKRAEIDLIVTRDNWLLFVEVKTRRATDYGNPEDAVGDLKVSKIFEAAEEYIYANNWKGHVRFDVISVTLGEPVVIDHFEDAIH